MTASLTAFLVIWIAILGLFKLLLIYNRRQFFCTILLAFLKLRNVVEETLRYMLLFTTEN